MVQTNTVRLPVRCTENITSRAFLPKVHNLNLIMMKHQTNQIRKFLQNNWPKHFKNVNIMKYKERLRNCLNVIHNLIIYFIIRGSIWTMREI